MEFKVILSGQFDFGSPRSYQKAFGMYVHKLEKAYKNDVMINEEVAFKENNLSFSVNRLTGTIADRTWRNTLSVLEMIADFSIAGSVSAWKLKEGKVVEHHRMEPTSEKAAVQSFLKGRELIVEGKETEAKAILSKAIEKFERHALAYERRGYVNYKLGNVEDALYDFTKSIDICASSPEAFMGRAHILMKKEDYKAATKDLDMVTKTAIPHQPVYWQARRLKAECHNRLEEFNEAAREYRFFTNRSFTPDNPNYKWTQKALFDYGLTLMTLKKYNEAFEAFDKSIAQPEGKGQITEADQFFYRGLACKEAGKKGFKEDLNKAADFGSDKAIALLASMS